MIVITLTKVPKSLRGDLTKWYQEIQTGVYVGNVSARIRDLLWDRIMKNIGHGEATMVYNANNELGYQFRTTRQDHEVVDFDGIPLMMHLTVSSGAVDHGFSNAAKFHKAKVMTRNLSHNSISSKKNPLIAIDLETTGLDPTQDEIISIGAVRQLKDNKIDHFYKLIQIDREIPKSIVKLTNITTETLKLKGVSLNDGLKMLREFLGDSPIVGYNAHFDEMFLTNSFRKTGQPGLLNQVLDLMPIVKKSDRFLDNYRLQTVLDKYKIENKDPHNSLSDADATFKLAGKLIENGTLKI